MVPNSSILRLIKPLNILSIYCFSLSLLIQRKCNTINLILIYQNGILGFPKTQVKTSTIPFSLHFSEGPQERAHVSIGMTVADDRGPSICSRAVLAQIVQAT
jgi:hypothetical protein